MQKSHENSINNTMRVINPPTQLRIVYNHKILSEPLTSANDSYKYLIKIWDKSSLELQEQVHVLYLNDGNQVISWKCLNAGTCNETLIYVKLALSCGLACMASKIIIAHNHPSGILSPSTCDKEITRSLGISAKLMDMDLIDHLIISRKGYYSFKKEGLL